VTAVSRRGWLLFCALCVIWGIPYLLIRVAVRELSPPALVFFRTALAALLLAPFALRRGELRRLLAGWPWVLAFALIEMAVPWLLLSHAEQQLTSSMAGLLIASVPLMGAVLYRIAGTGDHVDRRRLTGLVIGFVGVAALVGIDVSGGHPRAVAEVIVVALCYATGPLVISRKLADLPGLGVITMSLAVTAAAYAAPALANLPPSVSAETVAAVASLAVVCTALAFLVFFALILEVGPARSTVITYINPVVAVLLGVALLGEPFTVGMGVGLPLIIAGSILATAPSRGRPLAGPAAGPPAP
jgi:drug/metabolite transporter (DMT)-like permease